MTYFQEMLELAKSGDKQGYLFFICLYLLIVMTYSLILQIRMSQWPSVRGRLLKSGIEKWGGAVRQDDQMYANQALYTYQVDGKDYQGSKISPWVVLSNVNAQFILKAQFKSVTSYPDGSIAVYHHPQKHHKSILILTGFKSHFFTFVLAYGPIIWYLLEYL